MADTPEERARELYEAMSSQGARANTEQGARIIKDEIAEALNQERQRGYERGLEEAADVAGDEFGDLTSDWNAAAYVIADRIRALKPTT